MYEFSRILGKLVRKTRTQMGLMKNELRRASDLKKEYQRLRIEDMIARAARRDR